MKSIKLYLENLSNTKSDYTNAISISEVKFNNPNQKSVIRIETARVPYITDVLIPFLEGLT
jgi:Fe-S cluster assembly iron-binding protein IscA